MRMFTMQAGNGSRVMSTFNRSAGALPIVVVFALLFTMLVPMLSAASAPITSSQSSPSYEQVDALDGTSWSGDVWDWRALADPEGNVGVIVSLGQGWTISAGPTAARPASDDIVSMFEVAPDETFGLAFSGFSARVSVDQLESMLSQNPNLEIYPDMPVNATLTDSVAQIGADQLHAQVDSHGVPVIGEGIVVAVIDTGVDYTHPDLGGGFGPDYKVIGGYDFVNQDSDPMDDNGHGTHVAGIVAADGVLTGVAPGASLLAYKVLGSGGSGSMSDVIAAIERAMDPDQDGDTSDHADVISMSLGGQGDVDDPVCISVREAVEAGVVVVIAAGNTGPSLGTVASPGLAPEAITVGAVDDSGVLAEFSSRGTMPDLSLKPEISAPGVGIISTVPYDSTPISSSSGYMELSGTSMATPHVSGGAALLLQLHPDWTPEQVKSAIVTGASAIQESLWTAGAGELWLPESAETELFFTPSVASYGLAGGVGQSLTVTNLGDAGSFSVDSVDRFSLEANGTAVTGIWTNTSSVSPVSISLSSGGSGSVDLSVSAPSASAPEGYYEGRVVVAGPSGEVSLSFGFAVLSRVNVHVLDMSGNEVFDPYGGVWVYDLPDADIAMGRRGDVEPAPPSSFLLPSGTYAVHAAGHQLIYTFSDPYVLYGEVLLDRLSVVDVYLRMSEARQMEVDLTTDDGRPIYVKDYRAYSRHVGLNNVSFNIVGLDYSIFGSDLFSLQGSFTVFVSQTDATVGIAVNGFSYSDPMWEFMSLNWDHWYEGVDDSTGFYIESSADLQYMLAWEFDGVDDSSPTSLGLSDGQYSVFHTKYDMPGAIGNIWGDWGYRLAIGGDATFYARRDTETSLNPFYSGMTRTVYVQGVFSDVYFPGNLFEGFMEREFYVPDYAHLLRADTASEIYLYDRNYLSALPAAESWGVLGKGPYHPGVSTANTDDTFVLIHPLLRDTSGTKIGGMTYPSLTLEKDDMLAGIYQLAEFQSRPDAVRMITLMGDGTYSALIEFQPTPQICDEVSIELGFVVPSEDLDPPVFLGLDMPQRFVPGDVVDLVATVADAVSGVSVFASWRAGGSASWTPLSVSTSGGMSFSSSIQTSSSDACIDLLIRATDDSGNYIEYIASNAAMAQIPIVFELSPSRTEIGYWDGEESVILSGALTDEYGQPLSASGAVPIELMVDGIKVAMILDEHVEGSSHVHDGSIMFDWHFNPASLFSGAGDTIEISASFDLGLYEPVDVAFTLHSIIYTNELPEIVLESPAEGSLCASGTVIDLEITDDGSVTAQAYLDGEGIGALASPWDISTASWSEGMHYLLIVATDDQGAEVSTGFSFETDAFAPVLSILSPEDGAEVPTGWTIEVSVSDPHLSGVSFSLDGSDFVPLAAPYSIPMDGWESGGHLVVVEAYDAVGHSSSELVYFTILEGSLVLSLLSPEDGGAIAPGVAIEFSVLSLGNYTSYWTEGSDANPLGNMTSIDTTGWSDGLHVVTIDSTDDLGGHDEIVVSIWVDSSPPVITLVSPLEGAFVSTADSIVLWVEDTCFESVEWSLWGETRTSVYSDVYIDLQGSPGDGYFSVPVTATDLAGNSASSTFTFAMDSSAPAVSVLGIESGDAVSPGTLLEVQAEDAFLSSVEWTWDAAGYSTMSYPYVIDTGAITAGWQLVQVKAQDMTGKIGWANLSLYIDAVAPSVSVQSGTAFVGGEPFTVSVFANDDYMVGSVELSYRLVGGTDETVQMSMDGMFYTYELPAEVLWDNMTISVSVSDSVGNTAESGLVTLTLSEAAPIDDDDDGGANAAEDGDPSSLMLYIAGAGGAVASMLVLVLLLLRRSRDKACAKPRAAAPVRAAPSAPVQSSSRPSSSPVPSARTVSPGTTSGPKSAGRR